MLMRRDAIFRPSSMSAAGSFPLPSMKGGIFKFTPIVFSWSQTVKPRSAITEMFDFPLSLSTSPDTDISWPSQTDPIYTSETKLIAPLGVHSTKSFMVL